MKKYKKTILLIVNCIGISVTILLLFKIATTGPATMLPFSEKMFNQISATTSVDTLVDISRKLSVRLASAQKANVVFFRQLFFVCVVNLFTFTLNILFLRK